MQKQVIVTAVLLCALLAGCRTTAIALRQNPPVLTQPDGTLVFTASGMIFPKTVAGFDRGPVSRYDNQSGDDLSVAYTLRSLIANCQATVYVYPAPSIISINSPDQVVEGTRHDLGKAVFQQQKDAVFGHHPGTKLLSESEYTLTQGADAFAGWKAVFSYSTTELGMEVPLKSQLYSFCYLGAQKVWAIQYRFTYPASFPKDDEVDLFMKSLRLTFAQR